jgi:ADP-ribose pyrophosphatase YjhB (NUDIX family)
MLGIAQNGLAFTRDTFDRERFEALQALAIEIMSEHSQTPPSFIADLFRGESGYATPKIDVRAATFSQAGEILMVREAADAGRWTLPGGWADVNMTTAESVVKEVIEESGYLVDAYKLAAVWDRTRRNHPAGVFSCAKMFFMCRLIGGAPQAGTETTEVGWFAQDKVPVDLSLARVLPEQIDRMFAHYAEPGLPTDFD